MKKYVLAICLALIPTIACATNVKVTKSPTGDYVRAAGLTGSDISTPNSLAESIRSSQMQLLPKWAAALSKVNTQVANAKVLCIGDSTEAGFSPGTGTSDTNHYSRCYKTAYALNNTYGVPTLWQNTLGIGNGITGDAAAKDNTRLSIGAGWSETTSPTVSVGGTMFTASSATSSLAFTTTEPVDTFNIYYRTLVNGGTFSAAIDGGSATNQSTNAAAGIAKLTITTTIKATHTLNLNYVSGNAVFIIGWDASNSAQNAVQVYNAGWGGSSSVDWSATNAADQPIDGIKFMAPDLCIIDLGINDWRNLQSLSSFSTNIQTIITACEVSGDVILEYPAANATSVEPQAVQQGYITTLKALAATNNLAYVSLWDRWKGLYTFANNLGLMGDTIHPNNLGYDDQAAARIAAIFPGGARPPQRNEQATLRRVDTYDMYRIGGTPVLKLFSNDTNTYGQSMGVGIGALANMVSVTAYSAQNTAVGYNCMGNVGSSTMTTAAARNSCFGRLSLGSLTSGADNTALGTSSLAANTSGGSNVAVGRQADTNDATGSNETCVGTFACQGVAANNHSGNSCIGTSCLSGITTGGNNEAMGLSACNNVTSGSGNICIGQGTAVQVATDSNLLNIGGVLGGNMTAASGSNIASCGSSPSISGNDIVGTITEGSAATGCVFTFTKARAAAPHCVLSEEAGLAASYTVSTTALTITNIGALSSTKLDYNCQGQ